MWPLLHVWADGGPRSKGDETTFLLTISAMVSELCDELDSVLVFMAGMNSSKSGCVCWTSQGHRLLVELRQSMSISSSSSRCSSWSNPPLTLPWNILFKRTCFSRGRFSIGAHSGLPVICWKPWFMCHCCDHCASSPCLVQAECKFHQCKTQNTNTNTQEYSTQEFYLC